MVNAIALSTSPPLHSEFVGSQFHGTLLKDQHGMPITTCLCRRVRGSSQENSMYLRARVRHDRTPLCPDTPDLEKHRWPQSVLHSSCSERHGLRDPTAHNAAPQCRARDTKSRPRPFCVRRGARTFAYGATASGESRRVHTAVRPQHFPESPTKRSLTRKRHSYFTASPNSVQSGLPGATSKQRTCTAFHSY